jgi:hypothetical protein
MFEFEDPEDPRLFLVSMRDPSQVKIYKVAGNKLLRELGPKVLVQWAEIFMLDADLKELAMNNNNNDYVTVTGKTNKSIP